MKKIIVLITIACMTVASFAGCGKKEASYPNGKVVVYNWGEYIDPEVITMFQEETGIEVVYDEF
jgi:spermidine/putrescine-binding protein